MWSMEARSSIRLAVLLALAGCLLADRIKVGSALSKTAEQQKSPAKGPLFYEPDDDDDDYDDDDDDDDDDDLTVGYYDKDGKYITYRRPKDWQYLTASGGGGNATTLRSGHPCGTHSRMGRPSKQSRITGGFHVTTHQYPSYVWLSNNCGGVIMDEWTVLTAASCLRGVSSVVVSTRESYSEEPGSNDQVIRSRRVCQFDHWDESTQTYDLGLIRLESPLQWAPNCQPACLQSSQTGIGTKLVAVGAGYIGEGSYKDGLRALTVRTGPCLDGLEHEALMCLKGMGDDENNRVCIGDGGGGVYSIGRSTHYVHGVLINYDGMCSYNGAGKASAIGDSILAVQELTEKCG